MIVSEQAYDVSEPAIDSEIVNLQASGADVFVDFSTPKFAAQSIRKASEIGWLPMFFLNNVSASVGGVLKPAGFDAGQGIISAAYLKDPTDLEWKSDKDMKELQLIRFKGDTWQRIGPIMGGEASGAEVSRTVGGPSLCKPGPLVSGPGHVLTE